MELLTVDVAALHFPFKEWRWLRSTVNVSELSATPDAFLWAAKVGDALWAWHPRGYNIELSGQKHDSKVRVLLLKTDSTELEAHGLYLKTIFTALPAHDAEWAAALQVLSERFNYNPADKGLPLWWKEALEASKLSGHLGALVQRGRFTFLNLTELKHAYEKNWDLSCFELLETCSTLLREAIVQAIIRWNLSASNSKEAIGFAMMLTRKMGEKTALNIVTKQFNNAEEFRAALFRTAQPELANLSHKRIELLRALKVPARCSVFGDPSFENDVIKITHLPRKVVDFEQFRQWVNDANTLETMRALLEIYQ